jgi:uncharacterized iron-regulated membrane protein
MMRQYHRWFSFPLILFLFLVTVTGVVLQGEEVAGTLEPRPAAPKVSALPSDADLIAQVQKALASARSAKPDFAAQQLTLDFSKGQAKARFGVQPRGGPSIDVDLKTGETKVQTAPKPSLHVTMIQLHTGRMFGPFGLAVMMLVSLVFLVLTVTGFIVYYDMWKRRRAARKTGFFWK